MIAAVTASSKLSPVTCCRLLLLLLGTLLLSACQPAASVREAAPVMTSAQQAQLDQASSALRNNDPLAAADQYAQLAQTDPARRSRWQLLQADALYQGGAYQRSDSLLQLLDTSPLNIDELALLDLLQTENAIATMDHIGLQRLAADFRQSYPQLEQPYLPRAQVVLDLLQTDISSPQQLALTLLQQNWPDALLRETAFASLADTAFNTLAQQYAKAVVDDDSTTRGWLAAAAQARQQAVEQHFELRWQTAQAAALAALTEAPRSDEQQAFADLYVAAQTLPQRISVILPQTGNLQAAAEAIRMGIISAWSMLPQPQRPKLHFIAADDGMLAAYYQAQDLRSDLLLGPLAADNVSAMRDIPDRIIPMLALNLPATATTTLAEHSSIDAADTAHTDMAVAATPVAATPAPAVFADSHFFALPPEDSAIAAARWMRRLEHRNVIALGADDNIGQRQLQAFEQALEQQGGTLLRQTRFDPAAIEFTSLLNVLLGLQNSLQRHQQLQDLLGLELGFQARADANIDALFIAADQRQSRLLIPQLKFVDADYLPVFVTERSYSADRDSSADRDLGTAYITLPAWLLGAAPQPPLEQVRNWYSPVRNEIVARLFALGRDSLLLSAHAAQLQGDESVRLRAASGDLYIDRDGVVRRELQLARYRNGVIALLQ